jgi:NUDIX domain.
MRQQALFSTVVDSVTPTGDNNNSSGGSGSGNGSGSTRSDGNNSSRNNPRRKWLPVDSKYDCITKSDTDVGGSSSSRSSSSSGTSSFGGTMGSSRPNQPEKEQHGKDKEKRIPQYWGEAVGDIDHVSMKSLLARIGIQETRGGRMRQRKLGVLREDPKEDMRLLIENYTVPALASALRDREDVLQLCATLLAEQKIDELSVILRPFERQYVEMRRRREINLDLSNGFDASTLEMLRKGLNRMPRRVSQAHQRRAGVVLPLCNVDNVPCILFEKRSAQLRAHADEVCLPGGMVSTSNDRSIVATCLREMHEEIEGLGEANIVTLGVLRCNWGEVHHLVGVAVTPVVCYIGEIGDQDLRPNSDEVAECFTVPLSLFLDHERWVRKPDFAPIFTGGPHMIWGLTGYIVNRFVKDVLARYRVQCPSESSSNNV